VGRSSLLERLVRRGGNGGSVDWSNGAGSVGGGGETGCPLMVFAGATRTLRYAVRDEPAQGVVWWGRGRGVGGDAEGRD